MDAYHIELRTSIGNKDNHETSPTKKGQRKTYSVGGEKRVRNAIPAP